MSKPALPDPFTLTDPAGRDSIGSATVYSANEPLPQADEVFATMLQQLRATAPPANNPYVIQQGEP